MSDEKSEKDDLTALIHLGEFEHEEDEEVDRILSENMSPPELPPSDNGVDEVSPQDEDSEPPSFEIPDTPDDPPEMKADEVDEEVDPFEIEEEEEMPQGPTETELNIESLPEDPFSLDEDPPAPVSVQEVDDPFSLDEPEEVVAPPKPIHKAPIPAPPKAPYTPPPPSPARPASTEINSFGTNLFDSTVATGGNPPFSILLKNIRYEDDKADILRLLTEFKILNSQNKASFEHAITSGRLLISQLSEFLAVYLVHKMRHISMDITMGLSEEVRSPQKYVNSKGLLSKQAIYQNKEQHFTRPADQIDHRNVVLSTMNAIEGKNIKRFIGLVDSHTFLKESDLKNYIQSKAEEKTSRTKKEHSSEPYNLNDYYDDLKTKLKIKVIEKGGNAILGFNYQMIPFYESDRPNGLVYKIICMGNAVWLEE